MGERIYEVTRSGKLIPKEELVRCGQCIYWDGIECENEAAATDHEGGASYSLYRSADDYCSFGYRKKMSEFINRDALIEQILEKLGIKSLDYLLRSEKVIVETILEAPSIEIVCCEDCNQLRDCRNDSWESSVIDMGKIGWCWRISELGRVKYVKEGDFCSYGERKEE